MSSAKLLWSKKESRTYTIIGTPHYMAPEILTGRGYDLSADIWSLGVTLYELVCGGLPFGENLEDPFLICKEIISNEVKFPKFFNDEPTKDLIQQLLDKFGETRINFTYEMIKKHNFFEGFDWVLFLKKEKHSKGEINPTYKPNPDNLIKIEAISEAIIKNTSFMSQIIVEFIIQKEKPPKVKDIYWDKDF